MYIKLYVYIYIGRVAGRFDTGDSAHDRGFWERIVLDTGPWSWSPYIPSGLGATGLARC